MSKANRDYKNWENCLARVVRLKPKLQKRFPNAYLCVAVNSGTFGIGYPSSEDREGYMAAFADYGRKFGKITEATLFLGCRLEV